MKYYPKIPGEKVYLSPISLEDAGLYAAWLNDLATTRYLTLSAAMVTSHGEREALAVLSKEHTYAIIERASDELLGNCGLMDLDNVDRTAEIGIFIGDESRRGKGCGSEALALLCDYSFNILGMRSLFLRVAGFNTRAAASYRKVGFKEIGRRRKAKFYAGGFHDMIYMDLLPEDFRPSRLPPAGD